MVIQLLPRLSGKAEHLFISTELKTLCKFAKELHGGVFEPITDVAYYDEASGNLIWTCFSLACRSISALNSFWNASLSSLVSWSRSASISVTLPMQNVRWIRKVAGLKGTAEQVVKVHTCRKSQS